MGLALAPRAGTALASIADLGVVADGHTGVIARRDATVLHVHLPFDRDDRDHTGSPPSACDGTLVFEPPVVKTEPTTAPVREFTPPLTASHRPVERLRVERLPVNEAVVLS